MKKADWAREKVEQYRGVADPMTFYVPANAMVKLLKAERARARRVVKQVKHEPVFPASQWGKGYRAACIDILQRLK